MAITPTTPFQDTPQVIVQWGPIYPTANDAKYNITDDGIYTDYMVRNHYEEDPTIFMMPITSPEGWIGQKAAFVCLSEPTLKTWTADWTAEKRGIPPDVPTSDTGDPNVVLLYKWIDPDILELMADGGSVVYRLSGTYVYGFKDGAKAKMYHGRPPWMQPSVSMKVNEAFKKGIISP